jgi:molybdopterin-binding protein
MTPDQLRSPTGAMLGGGIKLLTRTESEIVVADPFTGEVKNRVRAPYPNYSAALTTAGGLVFHVLADDRVGPAFLSFAPSEVALSAERLPGSAQNVFAGRVVEVLPLPDRLRVVLDVGAVLVAEVTREAASSLGLAEGRTVCAAVKATAIRVY